MFEIPVVPVLLLFWFACGFIAAGYYFAYFQRGYPFLRKRDFYIDRTKTTMDVSFGVVSLLCVMVDSKFRSRGWLNPWSKKAKREAGLI